MKYISSSHHQKTGELCICPIGDLHIGSPHFKEKALLKHLEWIDKNRDNTRIILMGDLAETATKSSVGKGVLEQEYNGQQAMYKAMEYFKPFKGMIDALVSGNHEQRVDEHAGIDLTLMFAREMGIADKYMGYQGIVKHKVQGSSFLTHVFHGAGGGGTSGGAMNKLEKQANIVFANLYLMGHVHRSFASSRNFYMPVVLKNRMSTITQHFVCTGHALTYDGSYAEMKGLSPTSLGFPKIFFGEERLPTQSEERVKTIRVEL